MSGSILSMNHLNFQDWERHDYYTKKGTEISNIK